MTTPPVPPTTEIALLRSELLLLLADLKGDVRLILQTTEQADRRAAEQALQIQRLDERQDVIERDYVPRAEMQREVTSVREDMAEKSRRTIQVISLITGACGTAAGVLAAIIIALVN